MTKRAFATVGISAAAVVLVGFSAFYVYWEAASPERTCATCHEIAGAHETWEESAHRGIDCSDCHGTALTSGLHSLQEKARMVFVHLREERSDDIRLTEEQIFETMDRCASCHAREYADWLGSGHSATYEAIFLDETHNRAEQLSDSCLRCHAMFFEGSVANVVQPLDVRGPWSLVQAETATAPTMPCLACHHIHVQGTEAVRPDYSDPARIAAERGERVARVSFYDRYEKMHFPAEELPVLVPVVGGASVQVSPDAHQRVCVQCHATNAFHQAGSSDDRTPRGVHEGLSCGACHDTHSNDARASCANCHPRLSNCGLDVETMNTTFVDPESAHNIHFVACEGCHDRVFLTARGR